MDKIIASYKGKGVLVTGACGTIGQILVETLLGLDVAYVLAFDNNESEIFFLSERYKDDSRFEAFIGDVRDYGKLQRCMSGIDIVFHGAALKNVVVCEKSPFDTVQTNILGVKNVVNAAFANEVGRVLFMSSDKAVNPTNVMGTSKLMGERIMTAAMNLRNRKQTALVSSRFGNVLGSQGSVLPVFAEQIQNGQPLTLTDPGMTRFIMSDRQAVKLVLRGAVLGHGGEVFVTKMPVLRILDLARVMIKILAPVYGHKPDDIPITTIGSKPGEKLFEELLADEEVRRTIDLDDHFVVLPAFQNLYNMDFNYSQQTGNKVTHSYRSDNEPMMSEQEVETFLLEQKVLEPYMKA